MAYETYFSEDGTPVDTFLSCLAQSAGRIMQSHFKPGGVPYTLKPDQTPVTEADTEIGRMVQAAISAAFPRATLIREETDFPTRRGGNLEFIVDEVDGTDGFSRDVPLAVFAAAMLDEERHPRHCVIHAPLGWPKPRTFSAMKGEGALLDIDPIKVSEGVERPRIAIATAANAKERYHSFRIAQELADLGCPISSVTSISYSCAMLAMGHLEGVLFPWDTLHDIIMGDLLVREAGGVTTDLNGQPLTYTGNSVEGFIMANSWELHDLLLSIVGRHRREPG